MSLRHFILGLSASFGIAWLAIVVVPFFKMRNLAPVALTPDEPDSAPYFPKRTGRIADGSRVYAENGCYNCHTQVVRPTYAGNDMFREDWGGLKADPDRGDTRRETNEFDFLGEKFAHIGVNRLGPDLSNIGRRVESIYAPEDPAGWLYSYLYNPRLRPEHSKSKCPSFRYLFEEKKVGAAVSDDAVAANDDKTLEMVPSSDARALVSYLLALKKDQPVPDSLNFARQKQADAK